MDTEIILTAAYIAILILVVGAALIFFNHSLKASREEKMMGFAGRDLVGRMRKAALDLISESMDILPEKLMEAKRTVEREE